ncbi:MAG: threonylcarbamoyl-AMP synthase [Hyphomicrobiales bacterium]|nr:threonylcarbamoyl-AMP synthase [Hyphomicrobiales bacterium]
MSDREKKPQIIEADGNRPPDAALKRAVIDVLAVGGLVGLPTETVYGLAADATNPQAVARIYAAKGRPQFNPLIAHMEAGEAAARHGLLNRDAERLAKRFWPGPMTLVIPKRADTAIADLVTAGLDTVALRVPALPLARGLIAAFGRPIAAPSANRSGRISATTAADVVEELGEAVDLIVDAGPTNVGLESTIVACIDKRPVLLRPGGVSREEIEAVLGKPLEVDRGGGDRPTAPGMLASHYAPATPVRLDAHSAGPDEALLAFGPDLPDGADRAVAVQNLSPTGDLIEAAANLFQALRALDRIGAKCIAVAPIPEKGLGEAIRDRLVRAAAPR